MPDRFDRPTVLLYSGGLDSYVAAYLFKPDVLLNVDLGGRYSAAESAMMHAPRDQFIQRLRLDLSTFENKENLILPGRNAILAHVAAAYGDVIYLGATAGDRTHDKDEEFARRMNAVFGHIYAPQWWLPRGRNVEVELPIKRYTKRGLVSAYLDSRGDPAKLVSETFSCYAPSPDMTYQADLDRRAREAAERGEGFASDMKSATYARWLPCGRCKPCIRKWIALVVNGITPDFDAEPAVREAYARGDFDERGDEKTDALEALAHVH
jgi:7-cyano-7-deazaguanine synthase in queuosine biosynthesis